MLKSTSLELDASNLLASMTTSRKEFVAKYLNRMGLDSTLFDDSTSRNYELLCRLTEAHLSSIPFENLAQHGGHGGLVQLDVEWMIEKVLDRRRGGFCLELNTLFAAFLQAVGFHVTVIPAIVYIPELGGFDNPATHIFSIAAIPENEGEKYYVDVGFGEPPCHPLLYEAGKEQVTAEGMKSRLTEMDGQMVLEWFKDDEWKPRLQWDLEETRANKLNNFDGFQDLLDRVYTPDSIFSRKLIVCLLEDDKKRTLSGTTFKVTGPPRQTSAENTKVAISQLNTIEEVRDVLFNQFGMPRKETEDMNWSQIAAQDPSLFAQF